MRHYLLLLALPFLATLIVSHALAQQTQPCLDAPQPPADFVYANSGCEQATNFSAVPLIDGTGQQYGNTGELIALYGPYGNDEHTSSSQAAQNHYADGIYRAGQIRPLCSDGTVPAPACSDGKQARIVFLFLGFSNCSIEICGGHSDGWDMLRYQNGLGQLAGQPCATLCPNLNNLQGTVAWNKAVRNGIWDGVDQMSFLRQVYPDNNPANWLVGPSIVVFDGAMGAQILSHWDPTSIGHFWNVECQWDPFTDTNPECNYYRVADDLRRNGFTEAQVQAIFFKSSNAVPTCDLKHLYCTSGTTPDAYTSEQYLGNILRYLKCCKLNGQHQSTGAPRYPNLKQVFLTSRIYGGYGNGNPHGCLSPEPFAYESAFAIQRLITAQIRQVTGIQNPVDDYAGQVGYTFAPWVNWGPYLWASGPVASAGNGLNWCNGQGTLQCPLAQRDVRDGDIFGDSITYWGDYAHPSAKGAEKVANQLVKFIQGQLPAPQSNISDWVTPWIGK